MSAPFPKTLEEWSEYLAGLSEDELWNQAVSANSLEFVRTLREEGAPPSLIRDVLIRFVLRFRELDLVPPTRMPGQYLSWPDLLPSYDEISDGGGDESTPASSRL